MYLFAIVAFFFIGGGDGEMGGFKEFIYQSVVPACILAPLKPSFDLNDAQTVIVSNIALCKDLNRLKLITIMLQFVS